MMLINWLGLLLLAGGPFVVFAVAIHFLQRTTQQRLAERFGWHSVLWTGWLGTPIHELSHVIMCLIFQHRIDAVSLFEPDPESGRLGYVRHSWRAGNRFEELGSLFIGIAPLIGGSATLLILLRVFYPAASASTVELDTTASTNSAAALPEIIAAVRSVCAPVLQLNNLATIKFWVFVYLVMCVGSHMAPSWSDYRGTGRGAIMVLSMMAIGLLAASYAVSDFVGMQETILTILGPLYALLAITIMLCLMTATIVLPVVACFPKRFEVR